MDAGEGNETGLSSSKQLENFLRNDSTIFVRDSLYPAYLSLTCYQPFWLLTFKSIIASPIIMTVCIIFLVSFHHRCRLLQQFLNCCSHSQPGIKRPPCALDNMLMLTSIFWSTHEDILKRRLAK